MKNYIVAFFSDQEMDNPLFETDSLKVAKKWATRNRYYNGYLTVPCIYTHLAMWLQADAKCGRDHSGYAYLY